MAHIVLPNCIEYFQVQKRNAELNNLNTASKYEELRYFLNAVESMNNILDYYYYENEESLSVDGLFTYRNKATNKYPVLSRVAELANAYKHCVREHKGKKDKKKLWAKDLQRPSLVVNIDLPSIANATKKEDVKVDASFIFEWPIPEHEKTFTEAFEFWHAYGEPNGSDLSSV